MKKILSSIFALILVVFLFVGCSKTQVPAKSSPVVGNGGMVVMKDDYIYFTNGYISKNTENKNEVIKNYGIYRVKASNCSYSIVDGNLYFSAGSLGVDENGKIIGAEKIVDKVAGFENFKMYIFGDTLYYTSLSLDVSGDGDEFENDVEFNKVNLDGKKQERLGTVTLDADNYYKSEVGFFNVENKVVFASFNGKDNLKLFNIENGKVAGELSYTASEVSFPSIENWFEGQSLTNLEQTIVFNNANTLSYFNIKNFGIVKTQSFGKNETVSLIGQNPSYAIYTIKNSYCTILCKSNITSHFEITANGASYTNFYAINGRNEYVLAQDSSGLHILNATNGSKYKSYAISSAKVIATSNSNVFYTDSTSLYKINLFDLEVSPLTISNGIAFDDNQTTPISISAQYIAFYKADGSGNTIIEISNILNLSSDNEINENYKLIV